MSNVQDQNINILSGSVTGHVPSGPLQDAVEKVRDKFQQLFHLSLFSACHNLYSVSRKLSEEEIDTLGMFPKVLPFLVHD